MADRRYLGRACPERSEGIQQFRNRAYDPATGTWIQEDPMGVAGGVNLYRFNNGNPVSFGDPLGLCPEDAGGDGKTDRFDDCPPGSSGWYANRIATGEGNHTLNEVGGALAACGESFACNAVVALGAPAARWLLRLAGGGSAVAGGVARQVTIKSAHGARHLQGTRLTSEAVESAITKHVQASTQGASQTGSFWGRVAVEGQTIEYRAFTLPDGTINVGTYYLKVP